MKNNIYKEKIIDILDELGIKGPKAAEFMNIKVNVFHNKKSSKNEENTFNKKNYKDLVFNLKLKFKELFDE